MRKAATGLRCRGRRTLVSCFSVGNFLICCVELFLVPWGSGTWGFHGNRHTYLPWSIFSKTCPVVPKRRCIKPLYCGIDCDDGWLPFPVTWCHTDTPDGWWENPLPSEWVTYLDCRFVLQTRAQPEPCPTCTDPSLPVVLQWVALFLAWNPSVWNQEVPCHGFYCSNHTMHWTAFLSAVCSLDPTWDCCREPAEGGRYRKTPAVCSG